MKYNQESPISTPEEQEWYERCRKMKPAGIGESNMLLLIDLE